MAAQQRVHGADGLFVEEEDAAERRERLSAAAPATSSHLQLGY